MNGIRSLQTAVQPGAVNTPQVLWMQTQKLARTTDCVANAFTEAYLCVHVS